MLIIQVTKDINVIVGALGNLIFKKGLYAYVGSAQTNLELRVKRHLRKEKTLFWHIDYLLQEEDAKIIQILFQESPKKWECTIANKLSKKSESVNGFGCSDCNCSGHLFRIKDYAFLLKSMEILPF